MSNELDKQISEKLHGYESAVDAEAIWAAVRPPRRRRPWLWLFLLFGVLGLAGAGWWQYSQQGDLVVAAATGDSSTSQVQPNTTSRANDSKIISEPVEQISAPETAHVPISEQQGDNAEQVVQSTAPAPVSNPLANQSIQTDVARSAATNNTAAANATGANKFTEHITPTNQIDESVVPLEVDSNKGLELAANEQSTEAKTSTIGSDTNENELQAFNSIDYRLATLKGLLSTSPEQLDEEIIPLDRYRPSRRGGAPWSVQLDAAYLRMDRKLASDSLSSWMDSRLATESTLEALSTDLTVGYAFHKNWQLRAGLGYTQINTQFSLNNTVSTVDTVEGLQVLIVNPDNTVDSIFGPIELYETSERNRKVYNSFRQLELPVLLSYESGFGRLSVIAEGGVRIRLRRTWEGMIMARNGEEVLDLAEQDFYRTNIGFSLQAGLHLGYELSPNLQLRAGGTLRYSLKDFSLEDVAFQERYQLMGLQVGLRYSLR